MKTICFYPSIRRGTNHFLFNLAKVLESTGNFRCVGYKELKEKCPGRLLCADVYHINWFDQSRDILSFLKRLLLLCALKLKCKKIVWTIHNIQPHIKVPFYNRILFCFLARYSDVIHIMSWDTIFLAGLEKYTNKVKLIPHGDYYGSYPESNLDVREKFGIEKESPIFLFFGAIQPYKNIEVLVRAFRKSFGKENKTVCNNGLAPTLLICGKVEPLSYETDIRKLMDCSKDIVFYPSFIPDEDLSAYMKTASVLVVPYSYRSSLNSGTIPLAFSYGKTLVCPDIACVKDVLKKVDCLYSYHYESENEHVKVLSKKMLAAYKDYCGGKIVEKEKLAIQYMESNSWEAHKKEWSELYGGASC